MRLFFLLLLLFPLLSPAAENLSQREAELRALKSEIQSLSRQLEQGRRQKDSLAADIEDIEKRLHSLRQALDLTTRDLRSAESKASRIQAQSQELELKLKGHYSRLQAQLRSAFIIGRQAQARMLLSQDDPARLARMQTYLEIFQNRHSKLIVEFQATHDELKAKRREAEQAVAELRALRKTREQALQSIEEQRRDRNQLLAELDARLRRQGVSIGELRAEQDKLEQLIDGLKNAIRQRPYNPPEGRFSDNKGRLLPPLQGPRLARFNNLKADGESRWRGLWLGADAGQPIRAIADGQVVYVGWMHRYGLMLVLDHGDGYFSLYGHTQNAHKQVGDRVEAGSVIASAGDTGGHPHSGVYLEIRNGRKALNPETWLRQDGP